MRDVSDIFHLSNAYIAKEADISIKTVDRIMAINCDQDIMRATARRIELVVLGPVVRHLCDMDFGSGNASDELAAIRAENQRILKENEALRNDIERYKKIIDKLT